MQEGNVKGALGVAGEEYFTSNKTGKTGNRQRHRKQFTMKPETPSNERCNETSLVDMSINEERFVFKIYIY